MEYLRQFHDQIQTTFADNWTQEFVQEDITEELTSSLKESFKEKISAVREHCFDLLNKSLLSGEYIQNIKYFKTQLEKNIEGIKNINSPFPSQEELQQSYFSELNTNFIHCFEIALKQYIEFCVITIHKQEIDSREYITQVNYETREIYGENFSSEARIPLEFFFNNLRVAFLDLSLNTEEEKFYRLFYIRYELLKGRLKGEKFAHLLSEKCHFLISKWALRRRISNEKKPVYGLVEGEVKEISIKNFSTSGIFDELLQYIDSHYEISNISWKEAIRIQAGTIRNQDFEKLSLKELHILTKFYKDVNPNLKSLKDLREEAGKRYQKNKSNPCVNSVYVHAVAYTYIIDNEFSLTLQTKADDEKGIDELYSLIVEHQDITGIRNFFPQYKYLEFLVKKLNTTFESKNALSKTTVSREIINKCENLIASYEENLQWSRKYYNYVYYLPYEECLIESKSQSIDKIYLASSFVLPLSENKIKSDFLEKKRIVDGYKYSINVLENLHTEINSFEKIKEEIKEANELIHKRDVKSMEVIGVFTALVTFVVSSIKGFEFINTPKQALLFMLTLSSSLVLFIALIFLISRKSFTGKRIIAFATLSMIVWVLFIYSYEDEGKKPNENDLPSPEKVNTIAPDSVNSKIVNPKVMKAVPPAEKKQNRP